MLLRTQHSVKVMEIDWLSWRSRRSQPGHLQDRRAFGMLHNQCSGLGQALGRSLGPAGQTCRCEAHVHC